MLSRVADAVFWMARYLERTDNVLRVLRTHYIASQDELLDFDWQVLTDSLGSQIPEQHAVVTSYRDALRHIVLNKQHDASLFTNIVRARENARSIQDFITKELWQCLNDYYHRIRNPHTEQLLLHSDPVTALDDLMRESILYYGTVDITMNRGEGYNFLNLGKYVERSLQSLNILQIKLDEVTGTNESVQWKYLLYSLSGYEFHSKFYKNSLQMESVVHQVMLDAQFPHSVAYSLSQSQRYFHRMEKISLPENFKEMEFLIGKALNDLRYSSINAKDVESVQQLIVTTQNHISDISQKLATLYFGYSS